MSATKTVLYLVHKLHKRNIAQIINAKKRKKAMEQSGVKVYALALERQRFIQNCIHLIPTLSKFDFLCIRIDGTGMLDAYTLLKLFRWNMRVIWEIHGFPEEKLYFHNTTGTKLRVFLQNILRKQLSVLVYKDLFVSHAIKEFAGGRIIKKNIMLYQILWT